MILVFVTLVIGLILLLKGAEIAVSGAEGLAFRLGVSATTIGLTVVAFGTSLPNSLLPRRHSTQATMRSGLLTSPGATLQTLVSSWPSVS
ncbi:MAG: hypothetical protein LUQ37_04280 [Methanoregulaceae archaeon]|nr:hypothetical protein [Methanoregulaceae archaeon]